MNLKEHLQRAKKLLREKGIESWGIDADLFMCRAAGLNREALITHDNYILDENEENQFNRFLRCRLEFKPVQYILNHAEFMGLGFYVDENVLIPRGDTECVTTEAIDFINENKAESVLDMCTGSGCIAVSIARYTKCRRVLAAEFYEKALEIAEKNIFLNNEGEKVKTIKSDMFSEIKGEFDCIISNPPYITGSEMKTLSKNVVDYEPESALFGGEDGLDFYRIIAENAGNHLSYNGRIFLEIGANQKKDISEIFEKNGYKLEKSKKDLSGLDRALVLSKNR